MLSILLLATSALASEPQVHRDLAYAEPKNARQTLNLFAPKQGRCHPIVEVILGNAQNPPTS
jgi:hypothetical protein